MLAIGDHAPTLSIPTDTDMFSLAEQGGKKVVIFFLKLNKPLKMILLTGQANSASLADFFVLGSSNSEGARLISK